MFVVFGLGKFVNHAKELRSFRDYGLPWPGVFVIAGAGPRRPGRGWMPTPRLPSGVWAPA